MEINPSSDDHHDPYSAAVEGVNKSLAFGFTYPCEMSESEYETLKKIQDLMQELDPAIRPA